MSSLILFTLFITLILSVLIKLSYKNIESMESMEFESSDDILKRTKLYCISLKDRDDRRRYIKKHLSKLNIEYIDAVDTRNNKYKQYKHEVSDRAWKSLDELMKTKIRKYHHSLTPGAIGCYLSHLKIYKKMIEQNDELAVIFEDDIKVNNTDYYNRLASILRNYPYNYDMLILGIHGASGIINKSKYFELNINGRFHGMFSYIITKKGAMKILQNQDLINIQIDSFISLLCMKNKLKVGFLKDYLFTSGGYNSDIQTQKHIMDEDNFNFEVF